MVEAGGPAVLRVRLVVPHAREVRPALHDLRSREPLEEVRRVEFRECLGGGRGPGRPGA
jgi:hypothetical protein